MNIALRKRSPDQKRIFPGDAASTLRALPRALPIGMDPSPHLNGVTECASMRDV